MQFIYSKTYSNDFNVFKCICSVILEILKALRPSEDSDRPIDEYTISSNMWSDVFERISRKKEKTSFSILRSQQNIEFSLYYRQIILRL